MPTAEETIDLKDSLSTEDLPIARLHEVRRTVHCSVERRAEVERLLENFGDVGKRLSSESKFETRRAAALWILGKVEEAIPVLEKARSGKERCYLLGQSYLDVGRYADAVAQLKEAYDADSSDPIVLSALAEAQTYAGLHDAAEALVDRILKKHADHADGHYVRALGYDLRGFRRQAIDAYEKTLEVEPGHAKSLFRLAYHYDLAGEDARAQELYDQLYKLRPRHVNTALNLGVILEDRGEYERALDCYRSVLDYFPNHKRAQLYVRDAQASMSMFYDEDAARREAKTKAVLAQPLGEITFSQRVRTALQTLSVQTIGELCQKSEEELLAIPNFGKTSLREVKEFLAGKGLSFSTGARPEAPAAAPGEAGGNVESRPLAEFQWSGRITNLLDKLEIKTVGDLLKRTETELLSHKNLGMTSIKEIRKKLGGLGLAMRAE